MIKKIIIKNFKSFENLEIDFSKANNNMFIYGENGSGKSNIIESIIFLKKLINSFNNSNMNNSNMNNSNMNTSCIKNIIKEYKMFDVLENMELKYYFLINTMEVMYHITFNNKEIIYEKLSLIKKESMIDIFLIDKEDKYINCFNYFQDSDKLIIGDLLKEHYSNHCFLSIANKYFNNNLKVITNEINNILVYTNNYQSSINIGSGIIKLNEEYKISNNEKIFKNYLLNLIKDIKDIYYEKELIDNKIKYNLIIKRMINGRIRKINFIDEANGIKKLFNIIPLLFKAIDGDTVLIDDIDISLHEVLLEKIIEYIKYNINGQLIATVHNTILLDLLDPIDIYIIKNKNNISKEIICVNDFNKKLFKKKRINYLNGLFYGIPLV